MRGLHFGGDMPCARRDGGSSLGYRLNRTQIPPQPTWRTKESGTASGPPVWMIAYGGLKHRNFMDESSNKGVGVYCNMNTGNCHPIEQSCKRESVPTFETINICLEQRTLSLNCIISSSLPFKQSFFRLDPSQLQPMRVQSHTA